MLAREDDVDALAAYMFGDRSERSNPLELLI